MNEKKWIAFFISILAVYVFCIFMVLWAGSRPIIDREKIDGYHCQPITEYKTLEDAKAQVERYQERVKSER